MTKLTNRWTFSFFVLIALLFAGTFYSTSMVQGMLHPRPSSNDTNDNGTTICGSGPLPDCSHGSNSNNNNGSNNDPCVLSNKVNGHIIKDPCL
jgi:hypothetical protein